MLNDLVAPLVSQPLSQGAGLRSSFWTAFAFPPLIEISGKLATQRNVAS